MAEKSDMGMSGMPPVTGNPPSGYVTPEMPGYHSPSAMPSGAGKMSSETVAPQQGTSKEMMGKMGQVPPPSPTQ